MTSETQVLVVGAGPTGLTLACCLARAGVDVRVVEASGAPPSMERGSRGTAYQVRTLEVFDDLGVLGQALDGTWTDMPLRFYRQGKVFSDMSLMADQHFLPSPEVPYPRQARPLQTWRVEEILWNRLNELGVRVETGRQLVDLEQDDDGVTAWIDDAKPGAGGWGRSASTKATERGREEQPEPTRGRPQGHEPSAEKVRVGFLVGCDGGHSVVRRLAGLRYESSGRELAFAGIVADVRVEGLEPTYMRMWLSEDHREVVLSPQPSTGNFQFVAQMPPGADGNYPEPSLELAQRVFDERAGLPGVRFHDMTWKSFFKVRESLADHFRSGRVFIAGDAAHLHSATGGHGANGGIQDGYNLGWKLAYVVHGKAPEWVLDTYEAERRPVAVEVLRSTGDRHVAMFNDAEEAKAAQRRLIEDPEEENRRLAEWMSQLWVAYPDSALNGGTRAGTGPTLGDRAPGGNIIDARTGTRLHLFDLFRGDHFTLLLFDAELGPLAKVVDDRFGSTVHACILKDIDDTAAGWDGPTYVVLAGRASRAYLAAHRPIVLVRPDQYIAFHGTRSDGESLLAHLDHILEREGAQVVRSGDPGKADGRHRGRE